MTPTSSAESVYYNVRPSSSTMKELRYVRRDPGLIRVSITPLRSTVNESTGSNGIAGVFGVSGGLIIASLPCMYSASVAFVVDSSSSYRTSIKLMMFTEFPDVFTVIFFFINFLRNLPHTL